MHMIDILKHITGRPDNIGNADIWQRKRVEGLGYKTIILRAGITGAAHTALIQPKLPDPAAEPYTDLKKTIDFRPMIIRRRIITRRQINKYTFPPVFLIGSGEI